MINVQRVSSLAILPTKGSVHAAGYDLNSIESLVIPSKQRKLVDTGLKVSVPVGYYSRIAPRSGLSYKQGIVVFAGVIDSDYTGVVKVILYNSGDDDFVINVGDRIAQLIVTKIAEFDLVEVDDIEVTKRGDGGFGSTGY